MFWHDKKKIRAVRDEAPSVQNAALEDISANGCVVEAILDLHHITSDTSRFRHLLCNLSPEVAQEVADVLAAPLGDATYLQHKQSILDGTTASKSASLQLLLNSEELGDRHPSHLLYSMRQFLGANNVDSDGALLIELFLQRLPQSTRLVLAAAGDLTLDRFAQLADLVHDATSPSVATLPSAPESSAVSRLESRIDQLAVSINALRTSSHDQRDSSSRPSRRSSTPSGPRSRSPRSSPICWYHRTSQNSARQCKSLYNWSGNAPRDH
ncbi:uncharacterized protein [Dermacentor albipictus]|uniref:uncharacterized protein n=1 Tax=Dermacentor albipictus TaxID=60249 RepID=UPI0038FC6309